MVIPSVPQNFVVTFTCTCTFPFSRVVKVIWVSMVGGNSNYFVFLIENFFDSNDRQANGFLNPLLWPAVSALQLSSKGGGTFSLSFDSW